MDLSHGDGGVSRGGVTHVVETLVRAPGASSPEGALLLARIATRRHGKQPVGASLPVARCCAARQRAQLELKVPAG